jgi:hypothetical protein
MFLDDVGSRVWVLRGGGVGGYSFYDEFCFKVFFAAFCDLSNFTWEHYYLLFSIILPFFKSFQKDWLKIIESI